MKYIVYLTVNIVNLKIYIGVHKTEKPNKFDGYIGNGIYRQSMARLDTPFHRAVRKYGYDKFKRTTIKTFNNPEEAYSLERLLVDEAFVQRKDTYNVTLGGIPGGGYFRRKEVLQYSLSGKLIKVWESISAAATYFGMSAGTLRQACVSPYKSRAGFQWRFATDENPLQYIGYYGESLRVAQYSVNGELLNVWKSAKQAAQSLGKIDGNALRTYAGNHKIYENYQWRLVPNWEEVPDIIEAYIDKNTIVQLDRDYETIIKIWYSRKELAKEFKHVRDALNGRVKTYKGFKWMYYRDYLSQNKQ